MMIGQTSGGSVVIFRSMPPHSKAEDPRLAPTHHVEHSEGSGGEDVYDDGKEWDKLTSTTNLTILDEQYEGNQNVTVPPAGRKRQLRIWGWTTSLTTPNLEPHHGRLLSRLLRRYPFLVEVWYWALIYWVYQLGRALTAVTLQASTVDTAREHALQVVHLEQYLGIFIEVSVQKWFLGHPVLMRWTNKTYSFIHIPGTILFLIVLFYTTTTRPRLRSIDQIQAGSPCRRALPGSFGPAIYERRRRTMAMCNLLSFIVFTFWPCMPPRLLSAPEYEGPNAVEAKSYGFVDTVHGVDGDSSVWTTNKFCNQYAAMPSLHFGYSFLIVLTVASVPLRRSGRMGWRRIAIVCVAMIYPAVILTAIVATANHFILDAVAGAIVCILAWNLNGSLLNLLPLEDYFLNAVRIQKS
ncbi:PAP2 superfamily-domain-containing protein [Coniochaeta sp. 2T2.1]|nr:PAP2 superfamily-domain-containing protein [Coniochaeta sp. 2T2.1]